jgi:cytochrome P450 family 110
MTRKIFMKLPNGPQTPPLVQMLQWIASPMSYMEDCANRYGDIFILRIGKNYVPIVFVHSPEAMQEMLTRDTKQLEAPGEMNMILEPWVGSHSVITVSGGQHQRQRQLLLPPFHGERMRTYGQVMRDVTEQVISQWQIGQPFDIRSAMQAITLRVIMQAVFGLYDSPRAKKIERLFSTMLDEGASRLGAALLYFPFLQRDLGSLSPWGQFLRRRKEVEKLLFEEIRERREQPDPSRTDILSLLMSAKDETGQPMTDEELRDELMTLLLAGHETTATALTWALYWLNKLAPVREKLVQEIDSLDDDLDPSTIFKLPYLNAFCCETLRIYPIAMLTFPRVVKTSITLSGQELEPGTIVIGSIYLTHHREDLYPQSKKFKPERFLERQYSAYEFLPFGGGARRCIGMAFAQFEMKIVLTQILSRLELTLVNHRDVRPKRRGLATGPEHPIQAIVTNQRLAKSPGLAVLN